MGKFNSFDFDPFGTGNDDSLLNAEKFNTRQPSSNGKISMVKRLLSSQPVPPIQLQRKSQNKNKWRLMIAMILCFSFFVIELIAGVYANSLALRADAFHLLTDAAAYLLSFMAIIIAQKPASKKYSYGFARSEVLGALLSVSIIWVLVVSLIIEAISKFNNPSADVNGVLMLIIACCGFGVNILLLTVLNSGDEQNINVRAAVIHAIGDLICSTGVIIASVILI